MAEITNLRQFRKQQARAEKRRIADANAALHRETTAQKRARKADAERAARHLDQHRKDD